MKTMRKQIDWFTVAVWALMALGLAVNPLFWILVIIGGCIIGIVAYAAVWCLGVPGAIIFLLLAAAICFFARKYELC